MVKIEDNLYLCTQIIENLGNRRLKILGIID
mgnify:CR=1 FL=1